MPPSISQGIVAQTMICSQVLTGTQGSFDTNTILGGNIPSAFNHLLVLIVARSDTSATSTSANLTFNNDTGSNYDYEWRANKGTSPVDVNANATTSIGCGGMAAATATTGSPTTLRIDIPLYSGTTFRKQVLFQGWYKNVADGTAGAYTAAIGGGEWRSTNAITRIAMTPAAGNIITGSGFYLYGIL